MTQLTTTVDLPSDDQLASEQVFVTQETRKRILSGKGRTDIHRRGIFNPPSYRFVGWYYLNEWKVNGQKSSTRVVSEAIEKFRTSAEAFDFGALVYGDFGKCAVCGARFAMGEVWQHQDTMDMIHIGCDCAQKYEMVSGTNWTAIADERRRAMEARKTTARNSANRAKIFAAYPELEAALKTDHYIVRDIGRKFDQYGSLSDNQIKLIFKIRDDVAARAVRQAQQNEEVKVAAPVGRQVIVGRLVSKKVYENAYGSRLAMTVKVETAAGVWLCWGTVPSALEAAVGDVVEFTATLEAGREPHFALFKRPTGGCVVVAKEVA